MNRPARLLLLLVPLVLGLVFFYLPGRAQQAPAGRFAFSDTTLLRDTLGLKFDGLFPLADSLRLTPDTLRALSIRYRYTLARLVHLADSLGMPVDSVGETMRRESFNPLARSARLKNSFEYRSSYDVQRQTSDWSNTSSFNRELGSIYLTNATTIAMHRYYAGGRTSLQQSRSSDTKAGWTFSPNFSAGGSATLTRYDALDPLSVNNEVETKNDFGLAMNSRQRPSKALNSEINLLTGLLDLTNSTIVKRGLSGNFNGRLRYHPGGWLTNDASVQVDGNLARSRLPARIQQLNTNDLNSNVHGTLGVLANGPANLNVNYGLRNSRVETLSDTASIQQVRTNNNSVNAALRLHQGTERSVVFTQRYGNTRQATASALNNQSTRDDDGFAINGRYGWRGWTLESNFGRTRTTSEYPRRSASGGYGERQDLRTIDGTLTWSMSRRMVAKLSGNAGLTELRYFIIGTYLSPPVPRDQYTQLYLVEWRFTQSERINTTLRLDVGRTLFINIPAASTSANTENRSYHAEWDWSDRLLPGLTATQRNQLTADYTYYTFLPASNDRLSLGYNTSTTLNAVITPRLTFDMTHSVRFQPSGNYAPLDPPLDDGLVYFKRADENRQASLQATLTYRPSQLLSLTVNPSYLASERRSTSGGQVVPQRSSRTLRFSGGTFLNVPVGSWGQLSGEIRRQFNADRTTNYTAGVPRLTPASETDYWTGHLEFSWQPSR